MITELTPAEFDRVRPLFGPALAPHLCIAAVLDGTNPGRVWVDDPAAPRAAFVWGSEGWYLGGAADNSAFNRALNHLIMGEIKAEVLAYGGGEFVLMVDDTAGADQLATVLAGAPAVQVCPRCYYVCRAVTVDWRAQLPAGYTVAPIDADLLARPGLDVPDHIRRWMRSNWGSADAFYAAGFGRAMLHGKVVVAWSLADCVSGGQAEIGIHTRPDYRRRGLATITAAATVAHALAQGYTAVGWHCDVANQGSRGVAERVGFELARTYTQHLITFRADPA